MVRYQGKGRASQIREAIVMTEWLRDRSDPFHIDLFSAAMGIKRRTAYRWLYELQEQHLVHRTDERCPGAEEPESFQIKSDGWRSNWVATKHAHR